MFRLVIEKVYANCTAIKFTFLFLCVASSPLLYYFRYVLAVSSHSSYLQGQCDAAYYLLLKHQLHILTPILLPYSALAGTQQVQF